MLGRSIASQVAAQRSGDQLITLTRKDVDLRDKAATRAFMEQAKPDAIIHAAAKVGGIGAKLAEPTIFLLDNLLLDSSVLSAAIDLRVPDFLYVGSAAVYPAEYDHPFVEDDMLTGHLEGANEGYAVSKIAAIKLCEYVTRQYGLNYKSALPSNLYGIHDHFELSNAHLVAATLAKVHEAKRDGSDAVSVWGDGTARREFTYSVDVAAWLVEQIDKLQAWPSTLNLGWGSDYSVAEYYETAKEVVGFEGALEFDTSKPSGVPQRLIDSSAARALGWSPTTTLRDGMAATYADYLTSTPGR
ncbi:MAG: GDP-L-fucose synthase [Microbacteriaceae bacterium]|nr:GDP-L-fucose synthase [Microbacteriaceae bacterium]